MIARIDQPILLETCLYCGSPGGGTLRWTACQTHKKIVFAKIKLATVVSMALHEHILKPANANERGRSGAS
jgi:hypothetical protein